jgi:membrane-associated protease RseP (regulator of RpoE activity)
MWSVDLDLFQFDYAMTWAAFFMNGDGTIYGRYGSRSANGEDSARDISVSGFKAALHAALDLHARYSEDARAVRPLIAKKQPRQREVWKKAEDIPSLVARDLAKPFVSGRNQHMSCIHCHMIANHELLSLREQQKPVETRKLWPYPMPDAVGMHMDPAAMATVERVLADSPADAAGLRPGDEIARFDGQAMLSTADIQWVLNTAPDAGELALEVRRDRKVHTLTLALPRDWRLGIDEWRITNKMVMLGFGFNGEALSEAEARQLGLEPGALAFGVISVRNKLIDPEDLRPKDVIVEIDGKRDRMTLAQLTAYVLREKRPGSTLSIVRRRDGSDRDVEIEVD